MSPVLSARPLGTPPWETADPFLFCVHHDDAYPAGNDDMGPAAELEGRKIGMDFGGKDGWSMYHGDVVPGFPRHPHRGFETITIARRGYIDHSDSLGATARFGNGDTQWMTAGRGIEHSEMFPLVERDRANPTELFQIWLNLPRQDKMVAPHFKMLWGHTIPEIRTGAPGAEASVRVVAGAFGEHRAPPPAPKSWAARPESDVAVWTLALDPNANLALPPARAGSQRTLYFFRGASLRIDGADFQSGQAIRVRAEHAIELVNGSDPSELLVLQGQPIGEPVVHYGPFVMNEPAEINAAIMDYRRNEFGGWPWPSNGPVHARDDKPFAIHADGRREEPSGE